MVNDAPAILATYTRSGFREGVHVGHAVVVSPDGSVLHAWGDPYHEIFPRSSNKPAQATAMVRHGLDLPTHLLALAAASHSGERFHLAGVREILDGAGLPESALQTPPDFPLDPAERDAWIADDRREVPVAMNCSGKHAAMLATCVINGWPTDTYRDPEHPLQASIRWQVEALAGEGVNHVGVDGCGAPVFSLTIAGLARSMSRSVQEDADQPARRVVDAMRAFPDFVGGAARDVTHFMQAVPGLVAKDGAEGVYVAALSDGIGIALKVEDGSDRARQVALAQILIGLGVDGGALEALRVLPVRGRGEVVGEVASPLNV
ncbi:MAG: asparaginase [Actinomycetales bacterium]|nr:asparaginase [Actinomycetales bacterium]